MHDMPEKPGMLSRPVSALGLFISFGIILLSGILLSRPIWQGQSGSIKLRRTNDRGG